MAGRAVRTAAMKDIVGLAKIIILLMEIAQVGFRYHARAVAVRCQKHGITTAENTVTATVATLNSLRRKNEKSQY